MTTLQYEHIKWTSHTKHVDVETGEIIEYKDTKKYIKIKTLKNVTTNRYKTKGYIEYTVEWRKSPQKQLFD